MIVNLRFQVIHPWTYQLTMRRVSKDTYSDYSKSLPYNMSLLDASAVIGSESDVGESHTLESDIGESHTLELSYSEDEDLQMENDVC